MRLLIFLIFCSACSINSVYRVNEYQAIEHQCSLPIYIVPALTISESEITYIKEAIAFWNKYIPEIFILHRFRDMNNLNIVPIGYIFPNAPPELFRTLASTHIESQKNGCMEEVYITLLVPLSKINPSLSRLILIHELGHVLGLDHSKNHNSIMIQALPIEDPSKLDKLLPDEEIAVRNRYGRLRMQSDFD